MVPSQPDGWRKGRNPAKKPAIRSRSEWFSGGVPGAGVIVSDTFTGTSVGVGVGVIVSTAIRGTVGTSPVYTRYYPV